MTGETDRVVLLAGMTPELIGGRFMFVSVASRDDAEGLNPGFHHDHPLVPEDRAAEAVATLRGLGSA